MGGAGSKQKGPLFTDDEYNDNSNNYSNSNSSNNQYYVNDDEEEYNDDECTTMPCFNFFFCPPDKSMQHPISQQYHNEYNSTATTSGSSRSTRSRHNSIRRKRKKNKYKSKSDPIGTPIQDDEYYNSTDIRQKRILANGGGKGRSRYAHTNGGDKDMFYNGYNYGLEVENSNHSLDIGNGSGGRSRNGQEQYQQHYQQLPPQYQHHQQQNHHTHQQQGHYHQKTLPKAIVHDGLDGERQFMEKYQMSEVLGVGSTSICHRCIHINTGQSYACKIIDKIQIEQRFAGMMEQFHSEIDALRHLRHPNIIQLYDVYSTKSKIYIVMELMAGGELFDYVVTKGTLTEAEASVIVRMVTGALVYMHECNIIHRDLKPENLLLKHKPNSIYDLEVKIIDFGLSKSMKHEPMAQSFLGTRGYLAPEMLQRRQYSREVDAWALGVIVFVLLCGCLPFDDDSSTIFTDEQIQSKFRLRFPRWARNLSPSAKDLLSKLLDVNPSTRYTAEQALRHPWICGTTAPKDSMLHSPGKINLTPGKKTNPKNVAAANRTQMNVIIKNRARANSLTRNRVRANSNPRSRQLVRKKSI